MAQLTVRDLEDGVAEMLRVRAAANGRSAEAEHRMILKAALAPAREEMADFAAAARLRARLAVDFAPGIDLEDSTAVIRRMRDERYG